MAQLSSPPRSHCPILPLQLDSGILGVQWGWSRGADHRHLPSLPPEALILSLPLTYYHLLPTPTPYPCSLQVKLAPPPSLQKRQAGGLRECSAEAPSSPRLQGLGLQFCYGQGKGVGSST